MDVALPRDLRLLEVRLDAHPPEPLHEREQLRLVVDLPRDVVEPRRLAQLPPRPVAGLPEDEPVVHPVGRPRHRLRVGEEGVVALVVARPLADREAERLAVERGLGVEVGDVEPEVAEAGGHSGAGWGSARQRARPAPGPYASRSASASGAHTPATMRASAPTSFHATGSWGGAGGSGADMDSGGGGTSGPVDVPDADGLRPGRRIRQAVMPPSTVSWAPVT